MYFLKIVILIFFTLFASKHCPINLCQFYFIFCADTINGASSGATYTITHMQT